MITAALTHHLAETARVDMRLKHSMERVLRRGVEDHRYWCRFWLDQDPHPGQLAWGSHRAKAAMYITGRQSGKTHGEMLRRARRMFYRRKTRHLNAALTMDQALLVKTAFEEVIPGTWLEACVKDLPALNGFPRFGLINGAELWFRSLQNDAKYIRGHKFHELNVDEVAYAKQKTWNEVLLMCIARFDGLRSGTSTPLGNTWTFYECGRIAATMKAQLAMGVPIRRVEAFFRHGPSYENPHLPARFWKRWTTVAARTWAQEIEGLFVDLENALFTDEQVSRLTNEDLNRFGDLYEEHPDPDGQYVLGVDLARVLHMTVLCVMRIDVQPWRVVHLRAMRRVEWPAQVEIIKNTMAKWQATIRYDSTGVGDGVGAFFGLSLEQQKKYGFKFTGQSKENLLTVLQEAGQGSELFHIPPRFQVPYEPGLDYDLRHFTWDAPEEEDEDGEVHHWDYLMALALAVFEARRQSPEGTGTAAGGRRATVSRASSRSQIAKTLSRFTSLWRPDGHEDEDLDRAA